MLSNALLPLAALGLACLGTAAPHRKPQQQKQATVGKAVYFITNGAENSVVALPIGRDGMLSKGTVTKTGGAGSVAIDGATKQPAMTDALLAQSSLTVVGNVSISVMDVGKNSY
jgi:hypothetical protein